MKECYCILYYNPLTTCKLNDHYAEIDRRAEELFSRLVKRMAEQKGAAEALKTQGQMAWTGKMNDIQARARGIVNVGQIYALYISEQVRNIIIPSPVLL